MPHQRVRKKHFFLIQLANNVNNGQQSTNKCATDSPQSHPWFSLHSFYESVSQNQGWSPDSPTCTGLPALFLKDTYLTKTLDSPRLNSLIPGWNHLLLTLPLNYKYTFINPQQISSHCRTTLHSFFFTRFSTYFHTQDESTHPVGSEARPCQDLLSWLVIKFH